MLFSTIIKLHIITLTILCALTLGLIVPVQAQTPTPNPNICATVTEIPKAECQELVTFYNVTNGAKWSSKKGWLVTNTPCSWEGITCSGGHVSQIIFNYYFGNNISGTLPDFNLPNLTKLDLNRNQLTGTIPNFTHLVTLTNLSLNRNKLTSVPNFTHLPNLTILDLNSNQLTGNIPNFTHLPNLTLLWLEYNKLSGPIPNLANLPKLVNFHVDHNQLWGVIPKVNWSSFTSLTLNNNCGLVAYDVAQATVLNSKDANWQVRNSVCGVIYLPLIVK